MKMTSDIAIPTHPLPDWLSGKNDEEMRRLCAEELGAKWYRFDSGWFWLSIKELKAGFTPCDKPFTLEKVTIGDSVPNYPASLDACVELRAALKDEEWHNFGNRVVALATTVSWHSTPRVCLNATPRQITLAFLLTRGRVAIS